MVRYLPDARNYRLPNFVERLVYRFYISFFTILLLIYFFCIVLLMKCSLSNQTSKIHRRREFKFFFPYTDFALDLQRFTRIIIW